MGIGTASPSNKLDIRGDGNFSGDLYVDNETLVNRWLYNQTVETDVNASTLWNSSGGILYPKEDYRVVFGDNDAIPWNSNTKYIFESDSGNSYPNFLLSEAQGSTHADIRFNNTGDGAGITIGLSGQNEHFIITKERWLSSNSAPVFKYTQTGQVMTGYEANIIPPHTGASFFAQGTTNIGDGLVIGKNKSADEALEVNGNANITENIILGDGRIFYNSTSSKLVLKVT